MATKIGLLHYREPLTEQVQKFVSPLIFLALLIILYFVNIEILSCLITKLIFIASNSKKCKIQKAENIIIKWHYQFHNFKSVFYFCWWFQQKWVSLKKYLKMIFFLR